MITDIFRERPYMLPLFFAPQNPILKAPKLWPNFILWDSEPTAVP